MALLGCALAGCANFGPTRLLSDQVGYSAALSEGQNDQTLLNIVRIRYGDSPVFLNTTQIISGYQLQRAITPSINLLPDATGLSSLGATGSLQMQRNPTFTLEPVTGENLARSIIRPLSPAELLPLSLSSLPIDVIFRLAVQSVNGLENSEMVASANRPGSPRFYQLLIDLRRLQMAALIGVRLETAPAGPERLMLTVSDSSDLQLHAAVVQARAFLGMPITSDTAEVVYGSAPRKPGQIAILTRPILGVLMQVASEIEVPVSDTVGGMTVGTFEDASIFPTPAVIVHSGKPPAHGVFAHVLYRGHHFWIADNDFESKSAYTLVQLLLTLAQTKPSGGTVVTIPAR
jgi:hypothetical protein